MLMDADPDADLRCFNLFAAEISVGSLLPQSAPAVFCRNQRTILPG
jgi:hypothetical protein